jgi:hypothetical protein
MSIQATIKMFRKRITDKALEDCMTLLEEEQKRRKLTNKEDVLAKDLKKFKEV